MNRVQAVVFDIDGTVIDTSEYILRAYEYAIKKHNFPARTRAEIATQVGKKIEECYGFLAPGGNHIEMIADHRAFMRANLQLVREFDCVQDMLREIKQMGAKVGLWTSRQAAVIESLERGGLNLDMFDCVIDGTLVKNPKPHPEGLFTTLAVLGVAADRAVMVGDADVDILAGKAAGAMATIGITHGFGTKESLQEAGADYIVDNLRELVDQIKKL